MMMMYQEDWQAIVDEWATLGVDILKRATGEVWEARAEVIRWDATITFSCGDFSWASPNFDLLRSKELNFSHLFIPEIMQTIMMYEKEQTNDQNIP